MAIAFGASLGTPVTNTGAQATTIALTTNVTIPSNSILILGVSSYNAGVTTSVAGGSLTWSADGNVNGAVDANHHLYLFRADAPAGLASGATITATFSGNAFGRAIFGVYFTAAGASSLDGSAATGAGDLASPVWVTGNATISGSSSVLVGVAWGDQITSSNTPATTTPTTNEALDFNNASDSTWALEYRLLSALGSYSIGGAFANSNSGNDWLAVAVGIQESGGGAAVPSGTGLRRFPLGV